MRGLLARGGNFGYFAPLDAKALDASTGGVWQLAAKVGTWFNVRHGEVEITIDDVAQMYSNFKNGLYPPKPQQLPIDYEHLSIKPDRKPGDGKAAGWILDADLRENGNELWILANWTDDAKASIRKGEYKGFSPLFASKWTTHGKKEIGVTLLGGALTNYQTIPDCVVTCSLDPLTKDLATVGDLPLGERERRVYEAINAAYPPVYKPNGEMDWSSYASPRFVWDDRVTFTRGEKTYEQGYTFNDDLSVTLDGDPYEVVINTTPVVAASLLGGIVMKVKNAQGQEIDIPAASLATLSLDALSEIPAVKDLRAKVPAEGTRVVPVAEFDTLTTQVQALSSEVTNLKTQNTTLSAQAETSRLVALDARIDAVIRTGKALPADREFLQKLAKTVPALFEERIVALEAAPKPVFDLNVEHGSGDAGAAPNAVTMFANAVEEEKKADPKIDHGEAMKRASAKKPALAKAYSAAMTPAFGVQMVAQG